MTKILVTGANGQLGNELRVLSSNTAYSFIFTDVQDLDITSLEVAQAFFEQEKPSFCINCAAYTAVDQAESDQELAYKINEEGARNLALACNEFGATMIQISTDFVFGGKANRPLSENDATAPQGVYAASKLAGEIAVAKAAKAHITIRTAWLYSSFGGNFVKTMQKLGKTKDKLTIIADQIGTPTYARDLATVILEVIAKLEAGSAEENAKLYGLYHYSNEGVASWYDFAHAVLEMSGINTPVLPIPTEAYPTPAARPSYSLMNKQKIKDAFQIEIPHWRESLKECIALYWPKLPN